MRSGFVDQRQPTRVKNRTPAEIQITAEQILKEAHDRAEPPHAPPKQKISDPDELDNYRFHKRKQFEDAIRRNQHHFSHWLKYAAWEENQLEYDRSRSIYERVLEIDSRNPALWTRYAEFEMRRKNVNLARNLWDRVCTLLPRVDQFWYKYAYMEELLGNIPAARAVFERWMLWRPAIDAWDAYVAFELRYKEHLLARNVLLRLVECHPDPPNWIKLASFEENHASALQKNAAGYAKTSEIASAPQGLHQAARAVYERAVVVLGDEHVSTALLLAYARFEIRCNEIGRARAVFLHALERLPKNDCDAIYQHYVNFEKRHGDRPRIDAVVADRRRWVYAAELEANPHNYDVWFDLLRLEEDNVTQFAFGGVEAPHLARIRDTYERAVANVPPIVPDAGPTAGKRLWRRYIYLWLYYAAFEETIAGDGQRATRVFDACLAAVPHKNFTFAKIWLYYARLLLRQEAVARARKTLGFALGVCPKRRLYTGYIEFELDLLEFDRARRLYAQYLAFAPHSVDAWVKYAALERTLEDTARARAVFELAVSQPVLDLPELLWKTYIDFEMEQSEWARARGLYRRLLQRTTHVNVWTSLAKLEAIAMDVELSEARGANARAVFAEGDRALRSRAANEERVNLLELWREFERTSPLGSAEHLEEVCSKFPRITRRRRQPQQPGASMAPGVNDLDDSAVSQEEYYDYEFPDDAPTQQSESKLLQLAKSWKFQQQQQQQQLKRNLRSLGKANAKPRSKLASSLSMSTSSDDENDEKEEENTDDEEENGQDGNEEDNERSC